MSFRFSQNFFCDFHSVWRLQFWVRKTPYYESMSSQAYSSWNPPHHHNHHHHHHHHHHRHSHHRCHCIFHYNANQACFGLVGLINAVMGTSWHLRHQHHHHQHHHCTLYSAYRWRSESVTSVWRLHPDSDYIEFLTMVLFDSWQSHPGYNCFRYIKVPEDYIQVQSIISDW